LTAGEVGNRHGDGWRQKGENRMTSRMQGIMQPNINRFRLGAFEVTNILDGIILRDGLHPRFGADQPAEAAHALAHANRIDPDKFLHPFTPTLVDSGKELVLFDTGCGTLARDVEALRTRLPAGQLRSLLPAAGYRPEDIDIVVITHGHPDHIGGLLADGKPAFPNARYVFGAAEFDFWKRGENVREARKANRALFMKMAVPLADRATFLKPGDEVVAGIRAIDAAGHAPGMLAYHLESGGRQALIWADTAIHYVMAVQRPDWHIDVDDDKDKAAATRRRILDMVASDGLWAIGFHMPFPGVGYVEKAAGSYRWVPVSYQLSM
jgi:glyoxylase-like metal-dependent hydrolase (beta-lactamase superfamily II)